MLSKYELLEKLATGGMAEVYLARERGLAGMERLVVIKRILPHLAEHPDFVEMFLREGRIIARLNHPNIVQIHDLGVTQDEQYFLALEYIPGVTLREFQVLANKGGKELSEEVILGIGMQVASGLAAAHELRDVDTQNPLGLVHRDVTPHNLMCMRSGLVKLLDFGIAKATQGGSEATFSGDLKGKFSYMSPEQALQQPLDARSDIFSLGIVLWESLTGRRLFKRSSQLEMLQAISKGEVPSPSIWRKDVSTATIDAVMKTLARDPADRYQDARSLRTALREASDALGVSSPEETIAQAIEAVASDRLSERARAVQAAKERHHLSESQRHRLLHNTNSGILAQDSSVTFDDERSDDDDLPTIVERPNPTTTSPSQSFSARPYNPASSGAALSPTTSPRIHEVTARQAPPLAESHPSAQSKARTRWKALAFVSVFLVAGAVALFIKGRQAAQVTYTHPSVTLGWAPIVDPDVLADEMTPLHTHLSDRLDREVRFEVAPSYEEIAAQLARGEIEYAVLPPLLYVKTTERSPEIEALAIKEFDGSMTSDGLLLSRDGISPGDLNAIKGKKFCFTDRSSTTGNFLPRAYLRDQGVDPNEWIGEIIWSGDHLQLLRDLSEGKCDVGATHSGAFIAADKQGVPVSRLRTFAITGQVPQDVVCASKKVPMEEREAMKKALIELEPKQEFGGEYLGNTQRITGFVPAREEMYDQLRKAFTMEVADRTKK